MPRSMRRIRPRFAVCVLGALLALLAACGDGPEADPDRLAAREIATEFAGRDGELEEVRARVQSFFVGDPRGRHCDFAADRVALGAAFDDLDRTIGRERAAASALADTGVVDPRWDDGAEQNAAHRRILSETGLALDGARTVAALLEESTADPERYLRRADLAYYDVLDAALEPLPWVNRAKQEHPDQAAAIEADYGALREAVSEAKRLHVEVSQSWADAVVGRPYVCSRWALAVARLERLAETSRERANRLLETWRR